MSGASIRSVGCDFRVAIVGGGICGLVAAIGLNKAGIKVDIFESAASSSSHISESRSDRAHRSPLMI